MKLTEAKEKFIGSWGALGTNWGISKTMAQIHALLLVSPDPVNTEEIMETLSISRGNVNMNVRALIEWGLVEKVHKLGERMEFFVAEKDMWKIATRITTERRKRELEPILRIIDTLKEVEDLEADKKALKEFKSTMNDLDRFTKKADKLLSKLARADERWFTSVLLKMFK
ncbi:MAG: transcriptional regulator [Flavobacteriales bacterium]|nr:transcriptional regulator [Flavobacteriales bacterium]MDG1766874.1 transcriptional regulator [Flavobacteriales bacterium]